MEPTLQEIAAKVAEARSAGGFTPEQIDEYVKSISGGKYNLAYIDHATTVGQGSARITPAPASGPDIARAAATGATLGGYPRIHGVVSALTGGDYGETKKADEQGSDQFAKDHPLISGGVQVLGGLVPAALSMLGGQPEVAADAVRPGLGEIMKEGAKMGAKWGGAAGLIGSRDYTDPGQVARDVTGGAVGGGVAGGVTAPLVRGVMSLFGGKSGNVAEQELARQIPLSEDPRIRANMAQAEEAFPGQGRLMDMHPTMRRAAQTAATRDPGVAAMAEDVTAPRSTDTGAELAQRLRTGTGQSQSFRERATELKAKLRALGQNGYDELVDAYPQLPGGFVEDLARRSPELRGELPGLASGGTSFGEMQQAKVQLDRRITSAFANGKGNYAKTKLIPIRDELRQRMYDLFPGYQELDQGYATTKASREALTQGALDSRNGSTARDINGTVSALAKNPDAQNSYRLGLISDKIRKLTSRKASQGGDVVIDDLSSEDKAKVFAMFTDQAEYDKFMKSARVVKWFRQSRNAFAGSQTAQRQADIGAAGSASEGLTMIQGLMNPKKWAAQQVAKAVENNRMSPEFAKAMGDLLIKPAGPEAIARWAQTRAEQAAIRSGQAALDSRSATAGGGAGGVAGILFDHHFDR